MLEKYYKYKIGYKEYIILIKCGSFYESMDNDAFIMNIIFNYKLKRLSNTFKVGFPVTSLDNVLNKLNEYHINYIVVNEDIILEENFDDNKYSIYKFEDKDIIYNSIRIEKITKYLNENILSNEINNKLKQIENILFNDYV